MKCWKPIFGYEGIYEVSSNGEVRTVSGKTTESELHGTRVWNQRVLKQKTDKNGYKRVSLYKNKSSKTWLVHRLVATAFLDKPVNHELVNHIDGNPSNNHVDNLEWCDAKHNVQHAFKNGLMTTQKRIMIHDNESGETSEFYSMAEASRFLGKNNGFISGMLKQGNNSYENFTFSEPH